MNLLLYIFPANKILTEPTLRAFVLSDFALINLLHFSLPSIIQSVLMARHFTIYEPDSGDTL